MEKFAFDGTELEYFQELVTYWYDEPDRRAQEEILNRSRDFSRELR